MPPLSSSSSDSKTPVVYDLIIGGIAGGVSRCFVAPIDVIKIRLQLQTSYGHERKYRGIIHTAKTICKEEGVRGGWKGNMPAVLMVIPFVSIQMAVFYQLKHIILSHGYGHSIITVSPASSLAAYNTNRTNTTTTTTTTTNYSDTNFPNGAITTLDMNERIDETTPLLQNSSLSTHVTYYLSPFCNLTIGAISGMSATLIVYPLDLLRTVLAAQGEPKRYRSATHALTSILKTYGVKGLYAGLSPTIVEIMPYVAIQFVVYEAIQEKLEMWRSSYKIRHENLFLSIINHPPSIIHHPSSFMSLIPTSLLSGALAGVIGKFVTYPLDLIKKRFQVGRLFGQISEDIQGKVKHHPSSTSSIPIFSYTSIRHAFFSILRNEGIRGMYRGLMPSLLKTTPATAITFTVYEGLKSITRRFMDTE